jgi:hypothetical protein
MKEKNQPVGTVECNAKGCTEVCKVYRFRPRAEGRRTVFSGKHYFECPTHGRVGADGNTTVNEYILCNAKMSVPAPAEDSRQKNRPPARTPAASSSTSGQRSDESSSGGAPATSSSGARPDPKPARAAWRPLIDLD